GCLKPMCIGAKGQEIFVSDCRRGRIEVPSALVCPFCVVAVQVFNTSGESLRTICASTTPTAALTTPTSFAFDRAGNLVVLDESPRADPPRIRVFTDRGLFVTEFGDQADFKPGLAYQVGSSADGKIYLVVRDRTFPYSCSIIVIGFPGSSRW